MELPLKFLAASLSSSIQYYITNKTFFSSRKQLPSRNSLSGKEVFLYTNLSKDELTLCVLIEELPREPRHLLDLLLKEVLDRLVPQAVAIPLTETVSPLMPNIYQIVKVNVSIFFAIKYVKNKELSSKEFGKSG